MVKDIDIIKEKYNIKDFLDFIVIPYKIASNQDLLVKSPYNPLQKTESLRVRANYQGYYAYFKDFLTERKGDILNFVEYYYSLDTKKAIEMLKDVFNQRNLDKLNEIQKQNLEFINNKLSKEKNNQNIEITKIQDLQNQALIDYLQKRKIDLMTAQQAGIKEIYYKINNKNYFALCFENESGGYEVRNAYFKGSFGTKDITLIKKENSNELNVFEGFSDYASAIKLSRGKVLQQNNLILNSVAEREKAIETIKNLKNVNLVKLYLDNDKAGKETAKYFMNKLNKENIKVEDRSNFYGKYKDLNDFLNKKEIVKEQEIELER
jgi:5S rRNA maturation endonuclease (ribonuclease M5)